MPGMAARSRPNTLMINLHYVTALSVTGVRALLACYVTAIDHGTSYRVLHAFSRVLTGTASGVRGGGSGRTRRSRPLCQCLSTNRMTFQQSRHAGLPSIMWLLT